MIYFRVSEDSALATAAFGDQTTRAVDSGGMELHELRVLEGNARTKRHRVAVSSAGVGRGAGEVGAAVPTGGEDRVLSANAVDAPVLHVETGNACCIGKTEKGMH